MLELYRTQTGLPPFQIHLLVTSTKSGLIVQLLGGDKPHVGATVITHPRPSLVPGGGTSCNSIVIPELGHKEDELAKPLAEKIAVALNCTVVLVAGIHVENAGREGIDKIKLICRQLVEDFLNQTSTGK
jgi:hypothetical protein